MDGQQQDPMSRLQAGIAEQIAAMKAAEPFRAPDAVGAPAPAHASVEQLVEDWFRRHFHGLGDSIHQNVYNLAHAAKEELKQLLRDAA